MSMPRLSYDHRNHLKENLLQEKQERNIFDEIVNNKKFDEIFTKIGLNHKGHSIQFPTSDHVFRSLSRRIKNKEEKKRKMREKGLTKGKGCGNICKLSDERPLRGPEGSQTAKNLEKREKNLLTI